MSADSFKNGDRSLQQKDIFSNPFFAHSEEGTAGKPVYETDYTIKYESDDLNTNAKSFRREGNCYVKQSDHEKINTLAKPIGRKVCSSLYTDREIAHEQRSRPSLFPKSKAFIRRN